MSGSSVCVLGRSGSKHAPGRRVTLLQYEKPADDVVSMASVQATSAASMANVASSAGIRDVCGIHSAGDACRACALYVCGECVIWRPLCSGGGIQPVAAALLCMHWSPRAMSIGRD